MLPADHGGSPSTAPKDHPEVAAASGPDVQTPVRAATGAPSRAKTPVEVESSWELPAPRAHDRRLLKDPNDAFEWEVGEDEATKSGQGGPAGVQPAARELPSPSAGDTVEPFRGQVKPPGSPAPKQPSPTKTTSSLDGRPPSKREVEEALRSRFLRDSQRRNFKHRWQTMKLGAKFAVVGLVVPLALALGALGVRTVWTTVQAMSSRSGKSPLPPGSNRATPASAAGQDGVVGARLEEILERAPAIKQELEEFFKAPVDRQNRIVETGGGVAEDEDAHMALLASLILHPRATMDIKERSIDKIRRACRPRVAIDILNTAMVPGNPAAPKLAEAVLAIYRTYGDLLPSDMREDLKKWDEQQRAQQFRR